MGENRFQIRHGSRPPEESDLLPYEFGYDKKAEKLYMGREGENPLLVNLGQAPLETLGINDEIAWLEGAIENIQEQLNGEETTFKVLSIKKGGTGAATPTKALENLGINATAAELNTLEGVSSNVQNQLNNRLFLEDQEEKVSDLNELVATGLYHWDEETLNTPLTEGAIGVDAGYCLHLHRSDTSISQFSFEASNGRIYSRSHFDEGLWTPWKRIATKDLKTTEEIYTVGSVYITSTNSNPSSLLGGTWELIDKDFSSATFINPLTLSSSADESNVYATRGSHSIEITGYITPKAAVAPSTTLCTFNYETLGVAKFYATQRIVAYSSSGNILGMFYIDSSTGNLVFAATQTSGQKWPIRGAFFDVTIVLPKELMLDSACNKFYWKRTA